MSKLFKILCGGLLLLTVMAFAYNSFSMFWPEEKKLSESAKLLQQRFKQQASFEGSGWSLRDIYVADKQLFVLVDFPPESLGASRSAPVYSELVRYCPIFRQDSYWEENYAQPFTIYLVNKGENSAKAIARCSKRVNEEIYERITTTGTISGSQPVVLPKEGEDPQALDSAASKGDPSFNQAEEAMRFGKIKVLQEYLNKRPELVELYKSGGHTLLFYSMTPEDIKILIGYGADPNIKIRNGPTVLEWLSGIRRSSNTIKALIEEGADARQVAPQFAINGEIAELLLESGAPITENSLFEALKTSRLDVAEVLYAHGASLDGTTCVASSPLHYLIDEVKRNYSNDLEKELRKVKAALRFGASLDEQVGGLTPLEYIEQQPDWDGRNEIITMLRNYGTE